MTVWQKIMVLKKNNFEGHSSQESRIKKKIVLEDTPTINRGLKKCFKVIPPKNGFSNNLLVKNRGLKKICPELPGYKLGQDIIWNS